MEMIDFSLVCPLVSYSLFTLVSSEHTHPQNAHACLDSYLHLRVCSHPSPLLHPSHNFYFFVACNNNVK